MSKILLIFIAITVATQALAMDLDYVRRHYDKAVNDEKLCKELIMELAKETESNVHLGYLGAFQTIWATHTMNPVSKLKTFNKGKKNIEQAVKADPDNVELRFIRLSVQNNCPSFLGYNSNIQEDRNYIERNKGKVSSPVLKGLIQKIL